MDDFDANLTDAWNQVWERCQRDPAEARRRWERARSASFTKVPRVWCVALRAGDSRIGEDFGAFFGVEAAAEQREHEVVVTGAGLRRLCAPVRIDWPGVTLVQAGRLLGHHANALRRWLPIQPGRSRAQRAVAAPQTWREIVSPRAPLCVRYEKAQSHGHNGYDVPVVWAERPLDPGRRRSDPPHPLWGTLWQHLSAQLADQREQRLTRVPRRRLRYGNDEFKGWEWLCPGRVERVGKRRIARPCGKRCLVVYAPLPVMTLARALGVEDGLVVPGLKGLWTPGMEHAQRGHKWHLACGSCWRIDHFSLTDYRGWNEVVSFLSGGLLYGHEVTRPADLQWRRKIIRRQRTCKPLMPTFGCVPARQIVRTGYHHAVGK
jgi:hypothetical protein